MKPLSQKRRISYFVILTAVFFLTVPFLIMYAKGYRFAESFRIASTGGIYVSAGHSNAQIFVDEKLVKTTGAFQKSFFIQNLKPSTYEVKVVKDGFQQWSKTLVVLPETVTEANSFMLPKSPDISEITERIPSKNIAVATTSTSSANLLIKNPEYDSVVLLFTPKKSSATSSATTTRDVKSFRKTSVENIKGILYVTWTGEESATPTFFCTKDSCKKQIVMNLGDSVRSFDFFPGREDLLMISLDDGLYVTEIDDRSPRNVQKLFSGSNIEFRLQDEGNILIKEGKKYFTLSLETT